MAITSFFRQENSIEAAKPRHMPTVIRAEGSTCVHFEEACIIKLHLILQIEDIVSGILGKRYVYLPTILGQKHAANAIN